MEKYICTFTLCSFWVLHKLEAPFGEKALSLDTARQLGWKCSTALLSHILFSLRAFWGQVKLHNVPIFSQQVPH